MFARLPSILAAATHTVADHCHWSCKHRCNPLPKELACWSWSITDQMHMTAVNVTDNLNAAMAFDWNLAEEQQVSQH